MKITDIKTAQARYSYVRVYTDEGLVGTGECSHCGSGWRKIVEDLKGTNIGVVSAIHNFGAGPLVEIGDELIRFDGYNFPSVNTGKKRIIRKI